MAKFEDIYKQELINIRQLSQEFSESHPNVAPMLREESTDPDVERLLEGFAYISAQIQEIIDDQIPEFSGGLIKKFFPHYLRPLPSATIMKFSPKSELSEPFTVKKGTNFASIPVNGTSCTFRLNDNCLVNPLAIDQASLVKRSGEQQYIELNFSLLGVDLSTWWTDQLRFHLGDNYAEAAQLYYILLRCLERIEVVSDESVMSLSPEYLSAVGFSDEEALLPYPGHAPKAFRILQEYFLLPEKFLYLSLKGLDQWQERGQGESFTIRFYLNSHTKSVPEISHRSFLLHTAPAINLFDFDAKPIILNHQQYQYPIQPDANEKSHYPIFSVKKVQGYQQGKVQAKHYIDINEIRDKNQKQLAYDIINRSSISGEGLDSFISVFYNNDSQISSEETLSILLECTNGSLPEYLARGEINQSTSTSPSLLSFENLYVPSTYKIPPDDDEWMWRLQSMLSLNYLSIANTENLKSLLRFYLFLNKNRHITRTSFERQIDSIEDVAVKDINRMISGILMRGQNIRIKCKFNQFTSDGEAFLFMSVIDYFFATYVSINSFTLLNLVDSTTEEEIIWPIRMGDQLQS